MPDNVAVTPGAGVTIATRDIGGGVEAQRIIPQTYSTPGVAGGSANDVGPGNPMLVGGAAATGAVPVGNPVLVSGFDGTNVRSVATDTSGRPIVSVWQMPAAAVLADATANPTTGLLEALNGLFNGTSWDRQRGNLDSITLVASGAYTITQTGADQTNYNHRGVQVFLNVSVVGTGSITLEIDGKDPVSGTYFSLLTGAAVTTNSFNVYTVYPGGPATANVSANAPLPRTWRAKVTANNANSVTYSVGAALIV